VGCAVLLLAAPASAASGSRACDTALVRSLVQPTLPEFSVMTVRAEDGIVTLLLARRNDVGTLAVALRASGSKLFTEVMSAQLGETELARASETIGSWYYNEAVREALGRCNPQGGDDAVEQSDQPLRRAVEAALSGHERLVQEQPVQTEKVTEALIVVVALVVSLAMLLVPARARPGRASTQWRIRAPDLLILLCMAGVAVAIATAIAWRMAPEGDEVVTLGTRHGAFSYLLSWQDGAEPFNPPGVPAIFAVWLRLAGGFHWARILSIALIPLTAWFAYRAGRAFAGRAVGVSFAALVILAPAYLRLAAIARGYALLVFALCAMLAALSEMNPAPTRGAALGVAGLLGLWVNYLLWPLALALPWIARLDRRDRLRVSVALAVTALAISPRVANGFTSAMGKTDIALFEIHGPVDALGYALALAGQAAPVNYGANPIWLWPASAIVAVLIAVAVVALRRRAPRQLHDAALVLVLLIAPLLALLSAGHGIRDRHLSGLQVGLALFAATGLGMMIERTNGRKIQALGWSAACAVVVISAIGNSAVVCNSEGWIWQIGDISARTDLLMIVPRSAQFPIHAMLTGDVPMGSATLRWPPICQTGTERWCRRVDGLRTVSVDEVTDGVIAAAATAPRSIWILDARDTHISGRIPPRLRGCEQILRNASWAVLECSMGDLREGPVASSHQ
jgi:hypothetical protein